MILKKLYINNMFAYAGETVVDLAPEGKKNIILIGARNGRGKTSFLRIIRILIHGLDENKDFTQQDAKLTPNQYALGVPKKWEGIFNKQINAKKAFIKGIFEFEDKELIITRIFDKASSSFRETILVMFDKKEQTSAQLFLDNILPKNFAQFFFFDGEKLENIMNTQSLNIKDSLEVLLNIKTYEKLVNTIKDVQREYKKETKDAPSSEEIARLELKKNSLESAMAINDKEKILLEHKVISLKNEIDEKIDKSTNILLDTQVDMKPLKIEQIAIEKALIKLKGYIAKKSKGLDFLVLMTESLSREYLLKLEDNKVNYQLDEQLKFFKRTLTSIVSQIKNNVFDPDIETIPPEYNLNSDTTEFYEERIQEESDKAWSEFKSKKTKEIEQIIYYTEKDKERLNSIFEEKAMMYEKFTQLKKLEIRAKEIKNRLENATEDASEYNEIIFQYQEEKDSLEEEKSKLERDIGKLIKDTSLKNEEKLHLTTQIIKLEKSLNLSKPILNSIKLSENLIEYFQEFKAKLLHKKIDDLQNEFKRFLQELVYDKTWIKDVKINDKFEITLLNHLNFELSINSLSAGQRQLLATSLIQALASVSQVKSFICIDTPLARIDLENREQIIKNYYPKASKQVIILSTNSEIDPSKSEYEQMKAFIAKEYTILSKNYSSSFEEGYFNEISRNI